MPNLPHDPEPEHASDDPHEEPLQHQRVRIVADVRARRHHRLFVQFLGYPPEQQCWRNIHDHFVQLDQATLPGINAETIKPQVRVADQARDQNLKILQGRPIAPIYMKQGPRLPKRTLLLRKIRKKPTKKKRKIAQEVQTRTHTIRIGSDHSVQQVVVVRQLKNNKVVDKFTEPFSPEVDSSSQNASEYAAKTSAIPLKKLFLGSAKPAVEEEPRRPNEGDHFLNEVVYFTPNILTVRWIFPPSTPADGSTLLCLFDASNFDWASCEIRPSPVRKKSLPISCGSGIIVFAEEDLLGLSDGVYLFSLVSESLVCCNALSRSYCVSQRIQLCKGKISSLVGTPHSVHRSISKISSMFKVHTQKSHALGVVFGNGYASSDSCHTEADETTEILFPPPPVIEMEYTDEKSRTAIKSVYNLVDRLSYLGWGLGSREFPTAAKRVGSGQESIASESSESTATDPVSDSLLGIGARIPKKEELTASTSEGYGEATCATAERLIRLLMNLTDYVPSLSGWGREWNLNTDASFLDIGSGYGKIPIHAKILSQCRSSYGIECVAKRVEVATLALQGLYGELDRSALDDDLLKGVSFVCLDATQASILSQSHLYMFDRVFSPHTLQALASVLQRSPFRIMVSTRRYQTWRKHGLDKIRPICKMRFATTGKEHYTAFVYVNSHLIPSQVTNADNITDAEA